MVKAKFLGMSDDLIYYGHLRMVSLAFGDISWLKFYPQLDISDNERFKLQRSDEILN